MEEPEWTFWPTQYVISSREGSGKHETCSENPCFTHCFDWFSHPLWFPLLLFSFIHFFLDTVFFYHSSFSPPTASHPTARPWHWSFCHCAFHRSRRESPLIFLRNKVAVADWEGGSVHLPRPGVSWRRDGGGQGGPWTGGRAPEPMMVLPWFLQMMTLDWLC